MAKLKWIGGIAALLGSAMISIHVCRRVKNARKNDEYGNEFGKFPESYSTYIFFFLSKGKYNQ